MLKLQKMNRAEFIVSVIIDALRNDFKSGGGIRPVSKFNR